MKKDELKFTIGTVITAAMLTLLTSAVIVLSLQIAALTSFFSHEADGTLWNTKLIYACYNNKIYPCDDDAVSKWNDQNPDRAITPEYLRDPEY